MINNYGPNIMIGVYKNVIYKMVKKIKLTDKENRTVDKIIEGRTK